MILFRIGMRDRTSRPKCVAFCEAITKLKCAVGRKAGGSRLFCKAHQGGLARPAMGRGALHLSLILRARFYLSCSGSPSDGLVRPALGHGDLRFY